MVEAIVSILVVGVMLVAALNTVGAARLGEHKIAQRNRGLALAQDLMSEILQQAYADPEQPDSGIQTDSDENSSPRTDYDDVDGWGRAPWGWSPPRWGRNGGPCWTPMR